MLLKCAATSGYSFTSNLPRKIDSNALSGFGEHWHAWYMEGSGYFVEIMLAIVHVGSENLQDKEVTLDLLV